MKIGCKIWVQETQATVTCKPLKPIPPFSAKVCYWPKCCLFLKLLSDQMQLDPGRVLIDVWVTNKDVQSLGEKSEVKANTFLQCKSVLLATNAAYFLNY